MINYEKQLTLGCWGAQEKNLCIDQIYRSDNSEDEMESVRSIFIDFKSDHHN